MTVPSRVLREGIITSEAVNSLGWAEEVFYRRLHSIVDDFGRFSANHSLLRAAMYPLRLDDVSDQDVGKWLAVCAETGLVRVYEVGGKRYLEVSKFEQRRRADKSKYPPPPTRGGQMTGIRPAYDGLGEGEGGGEDEGGGKAIAPSTLALTGLNGHDPDGKIVERIPLCDGSEFPVPEAMLKELDRLYPAVDPAQTLREIRGWNLANPRRRKTKKGIGRHIFDWFAREQDKQSRRAQ